jgi:mono/diheme cytochrome c family protein
MRARPLLFVAALVAAVVTSALPLHAQQDTNPLSPGEGRDLVAQTCGGCHGLNAITNLREGKTAWRHQVYDMMQRGAQVSPAEIDTIVNYLATNYGPGIPFPGPPPAKVTLAPGSAAALVSSKCAICHGVDRVVATKRPRAQWTSLVARMVYLGAPLTADQTKTIVNYLATNYGT